MSQSGNELLMTTSSEALLDRASIEPDPPAGGLARREGPGREAPAMDAAARRNVLFLSASRVLIHSSFVFLGFSSEALLLEMCGGRQGRTQRIMNLIAIVQNILVFLFQPLAGRMADSYGRRPFLLGIPMLLAVMRYLMSVPGSGVKYYFLYRQIVGLAAMPLWPALQAMNEDLMGRGSDASILLNRRVGFATTLAALVMSQLSRYIPTPRAGFRYAAHIYLAVFSLLLLGTRETMPAEKRAQMTWEWKALVREVSPLSSLRTFGRSAGLQALAVWNICADLPNHNGALLLFRKHKHNWGPAEQSNQMLIAHIAQLLEPFIQGPLIRLFGLLGTFKLGTRVGILMNLNTALSPNKYTFHLNPVIATWQHSHAVLARLLDTEAKLLGIGRGELDAAMARVSFFFNLVMPSLFSEIYVRSLGRLPGANFLVAAALQLLVGEVVAPLAWGRLSDGMLAQVSTA
mmetsp:Transcript_113984/g.322703  ORF Transcript_113984/g.322703 Transcript_113984/m.322703 type:complete len:460 (-) Transcript_113984:146-1525(-)